MKRTVSDEAKDASKRGGGREERKQKWNIVVAGYKVQCTSDICTTAHALIRYLPVMLQ